MLCRVLTTAANIAGLNPGFTSIVAGPICIFRVSVSGSAASKGSHFGAAFFLSFALSRR